MALLTAGEAARLYGKSRVTIYKHCRNGKLTADKQERGGRQVYVIDMAELVRVYGEPPGGNVNGVKSPVPATTSSTTPYTEAVAEAAVLRERLRAAEAALSAKQDEAAWLRGQFEAVQLQLTDERKAKGVIGTVRRWLTGDTQ